MCHYQRKHSLASFVTYYVASIIRDICIAVSIVPACWWRITIPDVNAQRVHAGKLADKNDVAPTDVTMAGSGWRAFQPARVRGTIRSDVYCTQIPGWRSHRKCVTLERLQENLGQRSSPALSLGQPARNPGHRVIPCQGCAHWYDRIGRDTLIRCKTHTIFIRNRWL